MDKKLVALQLKVPMSFRRELKIFASSKDSSMVQILKEAFDFYQKANRVVGADQKCNLNEIKKAMNQANLIAKGKLKGVPIEQVLGL